ncbi:MAG TPA: retroviral-like aspartic protease family protein [Rhizomicrobium sp.]|nr:retroviral-like aspartic protease family protein [Rhizomicrobium sp.]
MCPSTRALFACAFLATVISAGASADECKLQRVASLDFTENGAIIIPVSLAGTSVRMALDTGSPLSAVDPIVAHNLHLIEQRIMQGAMYDSAGEPFTYIAVVHDLGLGDMHASSVKLAVWPSPMGSGDFRMGGTLGADLLRHFDVDIDFAAHKLSLFAQDHCPGKVVYWTSGGVAVVPMHVVNSGHIIVSVKVDGVPFDALLDTGSTFSHLSLEAADDMFHLVPTSPDMTKVSENGGPGGVPIYRHTFKGLELEGITIANPAIDIFENLAKARQTPQSGSRISDADESGGNTDMVLGLQELHRLHLYIAYKEQKLYISSASAPTVAAANAAATPASTTAAAH